MLNLLASVAEFELDLIRVSRASEKRPVVDGLKAAT
tara:strand:- start:1991 stop:2098 length:108 start_codon:yes stop_codon:yes gene_type:complete